MHGFLRLLAGGLMAFRLAAALPVFEPFNYPAGTVLDGGANAGGQTWSRLAAGVGSPQATAAAGNLSGGGWPAPSGVLAGLVPAGGSGGSRISWDSPVTSGTIFYAFQLRIPTLAPTTGPSTLAAFDPLTNGLPSATGLFARLLVRSNAAGFNLGVGRNTSANAQASWAPTTFATGDTILVVGAYEFTAGTDRAYLWINPSSGTFGNALPPAATVTNNNGTAVVASMRSLAFPLIPASPGNLTVDELRVATTWAAVTTTTGPAAPGPFVESIQSNAVANYTGAVIDSDDDAIQAGAEYDRESIRVETRFTLQNTNVVEVARTYLMSYRLLDPVGVAQPIRAFGATVPNGSNTYDPTVLYMVAAGATTNATNIAFIRPTTRLNPAVPYAVECRLFRDGTTPTGVQATDTARTYFHHTNVVSSDASLNVLTRVDSVVPTRDFALRLSTGSLRAFQAEATATVSRYDRFLSAPAGSADVKVAFQMELFDTLGGTNIPLRTAIVTNTVALAEWTAGPTRRDPTTRVLHQVLDYDPQSGIQLDAVAGRYRFRVTTLHDNAAAGAPSLVLGNRGETAPIGLLHFKGVLNAGATAAVFTNIVNSPANEGVNAPGIATHVAFGANGGGFAGSPLRFGSAAASSVRLKADGSADLLAASIPLTGGTTSTNVAGAMVYVSTAPVFGAAGLTAGITLRYPSGFGCREGNRKQPFTLGSITFANQTVNPVTLLPAGPLTATATPGSHWYFHEESKPLWFEAPGLTWDPLLGRISIVPTAVVHVRTDLYAQPGTEFGTAAYKSSNDRYWEFVDHVTSADVGITADSSGRAQATFSVALKATGSFEPHFPAETAITWNGGANLAFVNDFAVGAASKFETVDNVVVDYSVGCRDCGLVAVGVIGETVAREMQFSGPLIATVDGGLTGAGTTPVPNGQPASVRDLGWGKSDGRFTHQVNAVDAGRFHMPGHFLSARGLAVNPAVADLVRHEDLPGILLLTGVDATSGIAVARALGSITNKNDDLVTLGNSGYLAGAGEYAGMNYTPTNKLGGGKDPRAFSWLAGQKTPFDPSAREKVYLRRSGVAGIHEATGTVTLNDVYGYQFAVSNLSLSFLGGQNEASGLNGGIILPYPANFTYSLEGISLRCNGQFQGAPRSPGGLAVFFDYWNTPVVVNGIAFEPPSQGTNGIPFLPDCDSDEYKLVFDVSYKPINEFVFRDNDAFTGRLAIDTDGNILGGGAGVSGVDSRLSGPTTLQLQGSNGEAYAFEPVTGGYLNLWKPAFDSEPDPGWFNLAGTLNVSFFEDLKIHLHLSPDSVLGSVHMMGGWPATGFTSEAKIWQVDGNDYFNDAGFDADNAGKPNVKLATYRDQTTEDYNPRAQKLWAQIVKFDYPLVWSTAAKEFAGLAPKEKNLLVLRTFSRLDHLRANEADLAFGAAYSTVPIATLTEMLMEGTGINDALHDAVGAQLSNLDTGLGRLGDILDSDPHKFWDPILDAAMDPVMDKLYDELEKQYAASDPCQFVTAARPTLDRYIGGALSEATSVSNKIATVAGRVSDLATVLGQTDAWLADVEKAIDSAVDKVPANAALGGGAGDAAGKVLGMFAEDLTDAAFKPRRKSREMATDILSKLVGVAVDAGVEELVDDLLADEDIPLDEVTKTLVELRASVGEIRAQLQPAALYATRIATILNAHAGDVVSIAQLATDDTVAYLEAFACGIDNPFLDVAEDAFKAEVKGFVKERFYATGIPGEVQEFLKELLYDLDSLFVDATNGCIAALNRVLERALTDSTIQAAESASSLLGDVAKALGAGSIKGEAHIVGDNLTDLLLDASLEFGFNGDREKKEESSFLKLAAAIHIRSLENEGDDGTCSAGAVNATEVSVNIVAQAAEFITDDFQIQADFLFAFANDPAADPPFKVLQLGGGFEVPVYVPLVPALITLKNIGGDASFGAFEDYLSANCDIDVLSLVTVTGGWFIGKTCSYKPFDRWAPDVQNLIKIGPDGWSGVYAETSCQIGVGNSCVLRAEYGGGIGFGFSWSNPAVLGRMYGYADGDFLCFIHGGAQFELDARGDLGDALNGDLFGALWFKGCAGIEVTVIFTVTENACILYKDRAFSSE